MSEPACLWLHCRGCGTPVDAMLGEPPVCGVCHTFGMSVFCNTVTGATLFTMPRDPEWAQWRHAVRVKMTGYDSGGKAIRA